ncbi:dihydroorotate dehydrogenase [Paenibacillus endophyticus]|uniref:Dihydroorotate dehydrogenase n=1 Tax=Paenibacillus endophyticus TaxID=1294268 RepID=A0A7W5C3Y2_9BACL|nr:hypothetical protein [Paenibacillus endophyticus]MBB3150651.1 dihydroorotate dehydrogenase [Paenibacillus endophyticus]
MPDWSYQTLFRPLLFKLPARLSRGLTLQAIGTLSKLPGGSFVVRTFGHMEPSPLLERELSGIAIDTPIGLSGGVDPEGIAHLAFAQFGIGFIEHGPVTYQRIHSNEPIVKDDRKEWIQYPHYYENVGVDHIAQLIASSKHRLPQFVRIAPMPNAGREQAVQELKGMMDKLSEAGADGFYLDVLHGNRNVEEAIAIGIELADILQTRTSSSLPLFLYTPPDYPNEALLALIQSLPKEAWSGIVVGEAAFNNSEGDSSYKVSKEGKADTLSKIELLRRNCSSDWLIKAGAGVHEPQDALDLFNVGADAIMLHSGLVFAGPGLPKRINEAIIYEQVKEWPTAVTPSFWKHWGWMCLLGLGMMIGGLLSWMIAATTVLLPYDLSFIGMTLEELHHINHHLLHFMSHDRITLAGTMITIGILYFQLARHGLREGLHWARTTLLTSGIVGFASFFLYVGYGYFDPLHAVAAVILLPMFLLAMRRNPDRPYRLPVNVRNDRLWRQAMWGQLCFVVLGFALSIGGLTISAVGITEVFVQTDLAYLDTTSAQLKEMNDRLIPLIAHDRAGFGGALLCAALAILIMALWGIQQGSRWLWWTFLLGGAPGFYAGLSVHLTIGYIDFWHLSPALFALLLYILGLILLYPYLMAAPEASAAK